MGRKKSVDKTIDLEAEVLKAAKSPKKAVGVEKDTLEEPVADSTPDIARPTVKIKTHKKRGEKVRSKRYQKLLERYDAGKVYPLSEAIELCQKNSLSKFDGSLELHLRLGLDAKDDSQKVRISLTLPFGTGKKIRIMAFVSPDRSETCQKAGADSIGSEKTIDEILSKERGLDFDKVVATPDFMPKLAKIAKILGPKGLMPSPKNATVTMEPEKTILELKKGRLEVKMDPNAPVLHLSLGKLSFPRKNLEENFRAVIDAVKEARPPKAKAEYLVSAHLSPTMGPSVKVQLS